MIRLNKLAPLAVAIALVGFAPAYGTTVIIDDFGNTNLQWPFQWNSVGQTSAGVDTGLEVNGQYQPLGGILGDSRAVQVSGSAFTTDLEAISVAVAADRYAYDASAGASGSTSLVYNGRLGMGLDADLSAAQFVTIDFADVQLADQDQLAVELLVSDGGAIVPTLRSAATIISANGAQSVTFNLSDLPAAGSIDWQNIQELEFSFDAGDSASFSIERIAAVTPEPGSIALLAIGAVALLRRR